MSNLMRYTLSEVCEMTNVTPRNVRYYIQQGLVDRPNGAGRGARYGRDHLLQLMVIGHWQAEGLSLERIRELLRHKGSKSLPSPRQNTGGVEVWSHIHVKHGIELHIQPGKAGLSPEQLRVLLEKLLEALDEIEQHKE
jgi:DNA-binding transcriptional MerR regulator